MDKSTGSKPRIRLRQEGRAVRQKSTYKGTPVSQVETLAWSKDLPSAPRSGVPLSLLKADPLTSRIGPYNPAIRERGFIVIPWASFPSPPAGINEDDSDPLGTAKGHVP